MTEQTLFRVRKTGPRVGVVETIDGKSTVCNVTVPYGDDLRGHVVTKQRAALFAAAPDLLASLEKLLAQMVETLAYEYALKGEDPKLLADVEFSEAAIAKAKGRG